MCLKTSSEFAQLENWVTILISVYKEHPTCGLAKTINYYLLRMLNHEEIHFYGKKRCDYIVMHKFWSWKAID